MISRLITGSLWSQVGVNKLVGIYYSLPLLPMEFQTKIENISEIILLNVSDRKITKNHSILNKIIEYR